MASHYLILILSLSGGVTSKVITETESEESGSFLDNVAELNDRGRESRLITYHHISIN